MGLARRIVGWGALLIALVATGGLVWLAVAPPTLLKLGTAYAAKIVCSNVALAGRDPGEVMALDVQARGHPLLKLLAADVEPDGTTTVSFPFGIAAHTAAPRTGLGCAVDAAVASATDLAPIEPSDLPIAIEPAVQAVLERDDLPNPGWRGLLVLKDGVVIGERYALGFTPETPLIGWSMTKTVGAALVGTAVERGLVSLEDDRLFPEWTDDRAAITLADLLAMEADLDWNEGYGNISDVSLMVFFAPDASAYAVARPMEAAPGTRFEYSTGTTMLLGGVLERAITEAGGDAATYPREALLRPLGMAGSTLETDPSGGPLIGSKLYAPPRDWARFARFLLDGGVAPDGTRLVPEGWVEMMMTPSEASGGTYTRGQMWKEGSTVATDAQGNDLHAMVPEETVWMRGIDGQTVALVPSQGLAVVHMGLTPSRAEQTPQPLLRAVLDALEARSADGYAASVPRGG